VGTTPEPVLTADPPKTETFDAEYVKKLRSEAAARRKEATDLAAQLKALEDEKLTASEKVARELKAAQDQIAHLTTKPGSLTCSKPPAKPARRSLPWWQS
jgi:DNA-binding protein H-NS